MSAGLVNNSNDDEKKSVECDLMLEEERFAKYRELSLWKEWYMKARMLPNKVETSSW